MYTNIDLIPLILTGLTGALYLPLVRNDVV
jgi:hypothetical protein